MLRLRLILKRINMQCGIYGVGSASLLTTESRMRTHWKIFFRSSEHEYMMKWTGLLLLSYGFRPSHDNHENEELGTLRSNPKQGPIYTKNIQS